MPTLYNDSNESAPDGRGPRQPRMGTIEVLLYNMASMLAGVAVGYDVRLSNVSPIHPKLYPKRYVKLRFMMICTKLYIPSTLTQWPAPPQKNYRGKYKYSELSTFHRI